MNIVHDGFPAGTSSGRPQSAVIIPVPEAEALVGELRSEYDPVAGAGVPAHITLIVPWIEPQSLSAACFAELDEVLQTQPAFDYELHDVRWFARRVLWLAPEPAEPFVKLTEALAERFGTPPWEDEFDEVIPHLTVAHASDGVELGSAAEHLSGGLPLACHAKEVHVMCGDGHQWTVVHRTVLH